MEQRTQMAWSDRLIEAWIVATIFVYLAFMLGPVVSLIADTPLYSMQSVMGVAGIVLVLLDVVTRRIVFAARYVWLLYGVVAFAALGAIRTWNYGFTENLFNLAWTTLFFALFYSYTHRVGLVRTRIIFARVFRGVVAVWIAACIMSFFTYVFQIGYLARTHADPAVGWTRQGFLESRLFGVFMSINQFAFVSTILLIGSLYVVWTSRKTSQRVGWASIALLLFTVIMLSGSRAAELSIVVVGALVVGYAVFAKVSRKSTRARGLLGGALASLAAGVILVGGWSGAVRVVSYLPDADVFESSRLDYARFVDASADAVGVDIQVYGSAEGEDELKELLPHDSDSETRLQRTDTSSENVSNNRFTIWGDYVAMWDEIGIIGLSPANYDNYIFHENPDAYVVTHIEEHYPALYESETIYHPHNAFIMVFVASGLAGLALLGVFLVLCVRDTVKVLAQPAKVTVRYVAFVAVICVSLMFIMFDQGLFFMNNMIACIFWLVTGYVVHVNHDARISTIDEKELVR